MKKLFNLTFLLTILLSMVGVTVFAHDFEVANADGVTIYYVKTSDTEVAVSYREYTGKVDIPQSVVFNDVTYSVTSIGDYAFYGCSDLTSVTIPNSVMIIGKSSFYDCVGLRSVTIPNSVTSIGESAFENCNDLSSVVISDLAAWCKVSFSNEYSNPLLYAWHLYLGENIIKDLVIPNSVTSIGQYAFTWCKDLTSITIPNSVTNIGNGAFNGCSALTSVVVEDGNSQYDSRNSCNAVIETSTNTLLVGCQNTIIPNSVTSIGNDAFSYRRGLTSIDIPYSVTSIGEAAFGGCTGLTSIDIPTSVTIIGGSAFSGCNLTSITIPNSVTSIGNFAFLNCGELNSITISNSVTSIGDGAFSGCARLTSVTIPNSVKSIGYASFLDCYSLTWLTIPNSVKAIGDLAFANCFSLKSVNVDITTPLSITETTFTNCSNATLYVPKGSLATYQAANCWKEFKNIKMIGSASPGIPFADINVKAWCVANWDTSCDGELSEEEAAAVTDLGEVFAVPEGIFLDKTTMTSFDELKYFTGLTSIGSEFLDCTGLTSVTIPNSVTSIGGYAFAGCSCLTSVTVDIDTPLSITSYTFYNRANATLYVPKGCLAAYQAAAYWKEFKSIQEIGTSSPTIVFADANVKALCVANWDTNGDGELSEEEAAAVTDLGTEFSQKTITSFNELQYFTGLTSIGDRAFNGCSGLTSVTMPNSVTSIGDYAFQNCNKLTSADIPNSVTSIGNNAFRGCSSLTSAIIPNGVTTIGVYTFRECSSLTSVTIPNSVTRIRQGAFYKCIGLPSVIVPNSVTIIELSAFADCSALTSVTLGNSVKSLGDYAFSKCTGLKTLTSLATTPPTCGEDVFSGIDKTTCTLIVPKANIDQYKAADQWKNFTLLQEQAPSSPTIVFADANVKALCVANWDTNGDGELSEEEAAAVTDLGEVFVQESITSFNELQYFTGLTSIANNAFLLSTVTSVTIPNSVKSIGQSAFMSCNDLASVTIGSGVTTIGKTAFYGCIGLTSITIPNNVTSIGESAFGQCVGLTSVVIPNGVTNLNSTFYKCSGLTSVTIPNSVTRLDGTFERCSSLTEILSLATTPPTCGENVFSGIDKTKCTLIVPKGSIGLYKAADQWKDFTMIKSDVVESEVGNGDISWTLTSGAGVTSETPTIIFPGCFSGSSVTLGSGLTVKGTETNSAGQTQTLFQPTAKTSSASADNAVDFLITLKEGYKFIPTKVSVNASRYGTDGGMCDMKWVNGDGTTINLDSQKPERSKDSSDGTSYAPYYTTLSKTFTDAEATSGTFGVRIHLYDLANNKQIGLCDLAISGKLIFEGKIGDANGDNQVTITDAVAVVDFILGNAPEGFDAEAADTNHDGNVNITDAVGVVDIILNAKE